MLTLALRANWSSLLTLASTTCIGPPTFTLSPPPSCPQTVSLGLANLGLQHYADLPVGTYSGGYKRKLATAVALVGDPTMIFLVRVC